MKMKTYTRRLSLFVLSALLLTLPTAAQQILLDHDWYLAGDKMTVAVEVGSAETASKVAYVELCDATGLQANCVIGLSKGRGQGLIELPSTLHSGYYLLSMYTRMGSQALQQLVPVVNIMQKSVADDIKWVATDGATTATAYDNDADADGSNAGASSAANLKKPTYAPLPDSYLATFGQRAENEGHCIYARIHGTSESNDYLTSQIDATLAVVGKTPHVFQGNKLNDSTVVFNTYGVDGRHSIVMTAETYDAKPLQIEVINPFATLLPRHLPHLTLCYNRNEVEKRSSQMQLSVNDTIVTDSTVYSSEFMATKPLVSYDLDEYRQFRTIREVLLEYVNFVHRSAKHGRNRLYVYNEVEGYSEWQALVLLDGMPVQDIDRLLRYDARRVHYINIYDDYFSFGNIMYKGVINIVTRTGKLTNFPPEKTSAYLVYDFPQK